MADGLIVTSPGQPPAAALRSPRAAPRPPAIIGRGPRVASTVLAQVWMVIWRLVQAVPILIGVTFLTFLLVHLIPGNPARGVLGSRATPSAIAALNKQWGLNLPLPEQYWHYLDGLLHGNLGQSLYYHASASSVIGAFIAPTIWLIVYSAALSVLISVPIAAGAAAMRARAFDHLVRLGCQIGLGMPQPWVGLFLILWFALDIRLFPVGGFGTSVYQHISSTFLPSLTIAISIAPILIRSLRAELLEVLESDYVTTARSKGLRESRVFVRHAIRNAAISGVTVLGLNIAWLVSSTVVVELVFGIPGLGSLLVNSILRRDFPLMQSLALVFALMVVVVNLATDLFRSFLDPRVAMPR